jgi:DNA invertase Pin-like site-specific DNA recombinase
MPKAYSYLRFSTPEQEQGDSFRRQADMARKYAKANDLDLDYELEFEDRGVSAYRGENADTGALSEFFEAIREGVVEKGSYLLVESLDRISRAELVDAQTAFMQIITAGISVVTLADDKLYNRDTLNANPMDLVFSILILMRAHEESLTKSRRQKAVWEAKRSEAKSKPISARGPAWLKLRDDRDAFEAIEERADVVRRIFRMTADGIGQHKIAQTFNEEGVPVFGSGVHWHRTYIKKVLQSPSVVGTFIPHTVHHEDGKKRRIPNDPIEGYYPAIIDGQTYSDVQALLKTKSSARGRHKDAPLRNLLGGLSKCGHCGSTMTLVNKGKGNGQTKLVCTKAKAGAGCEYISVDYEYVEGQVYMFLHQLDEIVPPKNLTNDLEERLTFLDMEIAGHEEAIGQLIDVARETSAPEVAGRIQEHDQERRRLEDEKWELLQTHELFTPQMVQARIDRLTALLETPFEPGQDRREANSILRQLFTKIIITPEATKLVTEYCWTQGASVSISDFGWSKSKRK